MNAPADYQPDFEPLRQLLGARFAESLSVRDLHRRGEGFGDGFPPLAVAFPVVTDEVAAVLKFCNDGRMPVVPFGAGTSLEGQVQPPPNAICLDMSLMRRILAVDAEDMDVHVEAGVTRLQLEKELRHTGLFFPVDPGADATLGGMAATRASGTTTVRYGAMRDLTLGLKVVTPAGEVIETGGRARKSAAGYDLTSLYLGSEGTLGVITELRLKLFGRPEEVAVATCQFSDLTSAVSAVTASLQSGIPLARIELLDDLQMQASIAYSGLSEFTARPTLFLEFHGSQTAVRAQIREMSAITREEGGSEFLWATATEDRARIWTARHNAYYAGLALAPGKSAFATDACVPISRLAECILAARTDADESGLICPILGHVGDGNFHVLILHDPGDEEECTKAQKLADQIARRAIQMGGTCTGEHGIGRHKRELLREQHGGAVTVMAAVKQAMDPAGIMNPGAIFAGA